MGCGDADYSHLSPMSPQHAREKVGSWSTVVQSAERIKFMCVFWQTAGLGQFAKNRSKMHNILPLQRNQAMLASALGRHSARIAKALAIVTAGQFVLRKSRQNLRIAHVFRAQSGFCVP